MDESGCNDDSRTEVFGESIDQSPLFMSPDIMRAYSKKGLGMDLLDLKTMGSRVPKREVT